MKTLKVAGTMTETRIAKRMHYGEYKNYYSENWTVDNSYDPATKTIEVLVVPEMEIIQEHTSPRNDKFYIGKLDGLYFGVRVANTMQGRQIRSTFPKMNHVSDTIEEVIEKIKINDEEITRRESA